MAELSADNRGQQLLESDRKLQQARSNIMEATRTALETEETGFSVLTDLARQREQISRTTNEVDSINHSITQSRQVMLQMSRRAAIKRKALWVMIVLLLVTLVLVVYFLWIKKK
mmetsp:Transcript_78117/g.203507  ORF Transcript_78117/g.203507 Transcript_78117/m.203507 type:complete len:114 (+) Transcript_78117:86-427(+)